MKGSFMAPNDPWPSLVVLGNADRDMQKAHKYLTSVEISTFSEVDKRQILRYCERIRDWTLAIQNLVSDDGERPL